MDRGRRPHVLSITCHDLGRHLGCYGIGSVRSEFVDRLAAEGARFDRAFCAAPQCSPSRAALATGRRPHSNGVMGLTHGGFGWDLADGERPVATLLAEQGYTTHLFGLQHVTRRLDRLGFAHVHATGRTDAGATQARPGEVVAGAFEEVLPAAVRADGPLYLEVNLFEPHRPYDHGGVKPDATKGVLVPPYLPAIPEAEEELAALQGAIRKVDVTVGRILDALDTAGLAEGTLVVFSADHGLAMPRAKCTLYDPGIGIALLVRWPAGGVVPGTVTQALVSNLDVLPALLEAAGLPAPDGMQGRSLLPLARGSAPAERRDAVFAEKTFHSYYDPMRCVRTERHKLIRNFESAFAVEVPGDVQQGAIFRADPSRYATDRRSLVELYDLERDPLEQRNLVGRPEMAEVELDLDARLWRWMEETHDPLLQGPVRSPAYGHAMGDVHRDAARPTAE